VTRSALVRTAAVAALLTAAVVLTGCAPHPSPTASPSKTSHAASTPTPSATPTLTALPADVLFQITVVATAPDGAIARLTETVHAPVAATATQSADETLLDTQVTAGTWNTDNAIAVDMAGYPVWTGDQRPFQAYCASSLPSIPGAARAVSPVGGGDADTDGGWGIYRYGFAIPTDPSAGDTPAATDVVLSKCRIQLGTAASDSVFAGTWPTTAQTDNGLSCFFGGT